MATNGNIRRKLNITKGLTIVAMIMLFIIMAYSVWQMAIGGKNEEHLSKVALACGQSVFFLVIVFHGKELVSKLTQLVLAFKGIATGLIEKNKPADEQEETEGNG